VREDLLCTVEVIGFWQNQEGENFVEVAFLGLHPGDFRVSKNKFPLKGFPHTSGFHSTPQKACEKALQDLREEKAQLDDKLAKVFKTMNSGFGSGS
jgi:hypothetical protein